MERKTPVRITSQSNANYNIPTLVATSLALFLTSFMTSGMNVAIPFINHEFHADAFLLSWVVSSFLLVLSVFLVPFGRIADIIGLKKIFFWGIIFFTAISAITVFSNSIIMLITCRSLQGLSCAMIFSTGTALTTATRPSNMRGQALGINVSSVYIGYSAGPFLGGILTEHLGWRSMFAFIIPIGITIMLIILWKVKGEWAHSKGEKFDATGSIIYGLALISLIYGFSLLPEIAGITLIVIGIIGLVIFYKIEIRKESPVLNINIFKSNKTLLFSNLATLIAYCATFAMAYLISLYLQYIKAFTPDQAGLILLSQPLMLVIFGPFTGRLSDKIEPRVVASIGMALIFIGLVCFTFINSNTTMGYLITTLIVIGVGMALFVAPNTNAVMSSVIPKYYGIASSANGTTRSIGQTLSMSITTVVITVIIGRVVITSNYYSDFLRAAQVSFGIFSVLCFVGILISLIRGKVRQS
jgi:EmrB/QacA subfamily drug resistance transporter